MRVLLDTCVLAELRSAEGHPAVRDKIKQIPDENLFLSVLTIGEIAKGISLLEAGRKKQALAAWLNGLLAQFTDRILPVELEIAQMWGDLVARAQKNGMTIPAVDGLLAATALRHGLNIMTRNTRHFEITGAIIIDPWLDYCSSTK